MIPSMAFDNALNAVGTAVALRRRTEGTRRHSRYLREEVSDRPQPTPSGGPSGGEPVIIPSPMGRPETWPADQPDDGVRRQFGADIPYSFTLEGSLEGVRVHAALDDDGNLTCDLFLWSYAEVLAALGETLPYGEDGKTVTAGLEGPVEALVTFMHCMEVTQFKISMRLKPPSPGPAEPAQNRRRSSPLRHGEHRQLSAVPPRPPRNRRPRPGSGPPAPPFGLPAAP